MKIATLNKNDFINGEGVSVSLWMQGCPHHCKGCHNPEQWSFDGGNEIDINKLLQEIFAAIDANGIQRNFSVLGGEPLAPQNVEDTYYILKQVKQKFPSIKTFVWTGYVLEELKTMYQEHILDDIDVLIDGRFELDKRDITLKLRGSSNQRILLKGTDF